MKPGSTMPRRIGIFLFDVVEEIDAIGPWEAFAWWTQHFPGDGWEATTFSADGEPVTCDKSLVVQPHHSFASVPPLDVMVHPGRSAAGLGIDMALHVVARLAGSDRAREVREGIEYVPGPPRSD